VLIREKVHDPLAGFATRTDINVVVNLTNNWWACRPQPIDVRAATARSTWPTLAKHWSRFRARRT